jgi:hypothetical protein
MSGQPPPVAIALDHGEWIGINGRNRKERRRFVARVRRIARRLQAAELPITASAVDALLGSEP